LLLFALIDLLQIQLVFLFLGLGFELGFDLGFDLDLVLDALPHQLIVTFPTLH
jgi:hypothetical protein